MAGISPQEFVAKWSNVALTERAASQPHFEDLCRLLDQPTPTDADPTGDFYTFERGATKAAGKRHQLEVHTPDSRGAQPTETGLQATCSSET